MPWLLPFCGWRPMLGLRLYLRFFDTYTAVYGLLVAVRILMIWFYLFEVAIDRRRSELRAGEYRTVR